MASECQPGNNVAHFDLEKQAAGVHEGETQVSSDIHLDNDSNKGAAIITTSDGHVVLIPQPTDSPDDPLNWGVIKKHVGLAVVIACSFLPDYGSVTGAVTLVPQAK